MHIFMYRNVKLKLYNIYVCVSIICRRIQIWMENCVISVCIDWNTLHKHRKTDTHIGEKTIRCSKN